MTYKEQICKAAVQTFGVDAQINIAIEECAELIVALEHWKRGRNTEADVITEVADVQIVCEQLGYIFGCFDVTVEEAHKLERLEERIKKSNEAL